MLRKREPNLRPLPDCLRAFAGHTLRYMNAIAAYASQRFEGESKDSPLRRESQDSPLHRGVRIALLLAPLALTPMLAACVKTSAQPAPPPPPQVTVANVIERDVTEWDEFTGRLQA